MKLYIVDAFTDQVFGGNPAGVVYIPAGADFPDDETMRKTAAELRYSETAFLKELGGKKYHVRYFTPAAEVDLCGHATIATFYTL
ncbi:MAG: PhzF family phenazine biosynthesis protein, partial [Firmicutes bacterium]|nr:PhzF family phenazine biosynthesis protein [Bacillota bacterium]